MKIADLGQAYTPDQAGKLLGLSGNTMRRHRDRFGGIEVIPGQLRFFEKILEEKLHAMSGQENEVRPPSEGNRAVQKTTRGKTIRTGQPTKLARGSKVGNPNPRKDETRVAGGSEDRHGLLET